MNVARPCMACGLPVLARYANRAWAIVNNLPPYDRSCWHGEPK